MPYRMSKRSVGSGNSVSGWTLYDQTVAESFDGKDPTVKRVRPIGTNMLFSGTTVTSNKYRYNVNVYTKVTYLVGGGWSGAKAVVGVPITTSSTLPSTFPVSSWSTALRNKLKDQSTNIAQSLAEYRQTSAMFVDFSSRLVRAYRALRKGSPSQVYRALTGGKPLPKGWKKQWNSDVLDTASDNWLAWQYGIRPLISDLAGSIEEYYKVRNNGLLIRRVSMKVPTLSQSGYTPLPQYDYGANSWTCSLTGRLVCYAEFEDGAGVYNQTVYRLGFTNPALLIWELIPYSFVIDWFLQVGDFLSAAESIVGLKRVGIHVSSKYTTITFSTIYGTTSSSNEVVSKRTFYGSLPAPTLNFGSGVGSWSRLLSGLALIRQPASGSSWLYPSRLRKP